MKSSVILATASYDHTIRFWEPITGHCHRSIPHQDSQINRLEVSPDRVYIGAAGNPHVKFYELQTANTQPVVSYDGHTASVTALGFQREGKWFYTAGEDGNIRLWDIRAPGCQREYKAAAPITCAALHPNQSELLTGDQQGNVRVWDLSGNVCAREVVPEGENAIRSVAVSADGAYCMAGNNKGNVFVWKLGDEDTSRFDPMQKIEAHKAYILKVAFSADSKLMATCSADKTVKIWRQDATTIAAAPVQNSRGLQPPSSKNSSLRNITNPFDWRLVKTLQAHQRWVWDCCFSTDGAYLLTGSSDNSARLWDLGVGETVVQYNGHQKAVSCVLLID